MCTRWTKSAVSYVSVLLVGAFPVSRAAAQETGVTGGGDPIAVMQPSLAMSHIIRVAGDADGLATCGAESPSVPARALD
jgi:microcystin-dependent protein